MAFRPLALDVDALPSLVAGLARARPRPAIAWLDGDGSSPLGTRSYVGIGTTRALGSWDEIATALDALARTASPSGPALVRTAPAATLALSYDLAWSMPLGLRAPERLARDRTTGAWILAHDATLAIDHARGEAFLVGEDEPALDRLEAALQAAPLPHASLGPITAEAGAPHLDAIGRALEAITRGDLYQVNLARAFRARLEGDPLALALAMRRASPVPLGLYLEGPVASGRALVMRTMERFLALDAATRRLETRPIKGTRPRAEGEDARVEADLLADEEERAEHAMIVDLMRNDLGRVATAGSVVVREAMRVEPYARLSHLVSVVEATARPDVTLGALLEATFPPGSVTGAPKLAAIEHIEALEREARGFYTGAAGAIGRDGSLSLAVSIRTAQIDRGEVRYFAGGGIVEASDPARELAETDLKARVLSDAAAILAARSV